MRIGGNQGHRAVLRHQRVQRPTAGKGQAPAHWSPGDGNHGQARSLQVGQCLQSIGRDGAVGGQRVINVGKHAGNGSA